jgi:dipeptidase D
MMIRKLAPEEIWNHFEDLNAIPRPSKKEERVRAFMKSFGENLGLETLEDSIGNIIIKKPATSGYEDRKTVILQAHLDMVHQKNNATNFDFSTEGIRSKIEGDWVTAEGTTLGADNGMGVAAAMAILSADNLKHPAIEALFTVDEETGMTGAKELNGSLLTGEILLNLDTEDDDEFSVGCAGGIDTNTSYNYQELDVPANFLAYKIELKGLKGGHSGMDIHLGRGNANKWMNRLFSTLSNVESFRISAVDGGSLRNAIPRESSAIVVCSAKDQDSFEAIYLATTEKLLAQAKIKEPGALFTINPIDLPKKMMGHKDQIRIISALYAVPNGVWSMSPTIEGLVETSSSLARVVMKDGEFHTQSLQRSMSEEGKEDVAAAMKHVFELIGAEVHQSGDYPGWEPNPESDILAVMEKIYVDLFNETPKVAACHAGLECGILGKHLPKCDMISFGPTIRNPHSPDEKVNIASVEKFWTLLKRVLENIPQK